MKAGRDIPEIQTEVHTVPSCLILFALVRTYVRVRLVIVLYIYILFLHTFPLYKSDQNPGWLFFFVRWLLLSCMGAILSHWNDP